MKKKTRNIVEQKVDRLLVEYVLQEAEKALEEAKIVIKLQNNGNCLESIDLALEEISRALYQGGLDE